MSMFKIKMNKIKYLSILIGLLVTLPGAAQDSAVSDQIRQKIQHFRSTGYMTAAGVDIASTTVLPAVYERRNHRPAWTNEARVDELIQMVGHAEEEGLLPRDYHYSDLVRLRQQGSKDASTIAEFDLLLTDSLIRYGYHQNFGKVNPGQLDSNWNLTRNLAGQDPVELIQGAIDSDGIRQYISDVLKRGPFYQRMKTLLADYQARAEKEGGGYPTVPAGPTLRLGMQDGRVAQLRNRLQASGELNDTPAENPNMFDEQLEQAVRRFQENANIDVDGAVGAGTLAALNVSLQSRIDQIRVNMERIRWIFRDIRDNKNFILVNIAGFKTYLVRGHQIVWETRSQVGRTYRKTPVFRADMSFVQFNPTWTVPPGILRRDVLPKIKEDRNYLVEKDMKLIDNKTGKEIDPASIDWDNLSGRGFPYQVVQQPGPENSLGEVKFIFPNNHFVFLHDTPSKQNFDRSVRMFSSGCVRIENPFEFAELVLNKPEWDQAEIQKTLDSGRIKTVYLDYTLPVLVLYWTVETIGDDGPKFLPDVYDRDGPILKALNAPFKFVPPDDLPDWMGDTAKR